ncbi:hypothetical protein [Cellulomonas soli]
MALEVDDADADGCAFDHGLELREACLQDLAHVVVHVVTALLPAAVAA